MNRKKRNQTLLWPKSIYVYSKYKYLMTLQEISNSTEFITIGQVIKPHGIRGEFRIKSLTDDPQRFDRIKQIYFHLNGQRRLFTIRAFRITPQYIILALNEIASRNESEKWRNAEIEIPRKQAMVLPEGSYYYFELIGIKVFDKQENEIGVISNVLDYPAQDVLVVTSKTHQEYLIPNVPDFVKEMNVENGCITIDPIEGLLENTNLEE